MRVNDDGGKNVYVYKLIKIYETHFYPESGHVYSQVGCVVVQTGTKFH